MPRRELRPVWVEVTRRPNDDIGVDLNHDRSSPRPYRLLAEPAPGDRVLHWDSKRQQFVGTSVVRLGHRDHGTKRQVELKNFRRFADGSLTLEMIQRHGMAIGKIRDSLDTSNGPVRYPFAPYGSAGWKRVRPALAYLSVAPADLVALLGGIYDSARQGNPLIPMWGDYGLGSTRRLPSSDSAMSAAFRRYVEANEDITVTAQNEAKLRNDKALQAAYRQHNTLQNKLAMWLRARGLSPESKRALDKYPVDIQWQVGQTLFVAEVKSLIKSNELSQLRRGLGQILHYRYLAAAQYPELDVVAVLIVPRSPTTSDDWSAVCRHAGVLLAWPPRFDKLLTR